MTEIREKLDNQLKTLFQFTLKTVDITGILMACGCGLALLFPFTDIISPNPLFGISYNNINEIFKPEISNMVMYRDKISSLTGLLIITFCLSRKYNVIKYLLNFLWIAYFIALPYLLSEIPAINDARQQIETTSINGD